MSTSGPTQGAERHSGTVERWTSHPQLARLLRVVIVVAPIAASVTFTLAAGKYLPASELDMNRWLWIGLVFVCSNVLLIVLSKLTRRLIPLVALMKLTLVFPDQAPSRTKSALRNSNSRTMLREMEAARARGDTDGAALHGDYLVQLLKELNDHDRLTRGHSERVRAYSEMLGEEIGLSVDDLGKLRWAALLHDVGKLTVPSEVLNKDGRPTDSEWKVLSKHPTAATPMLAPLRPWLGDWLHAADQHHCRWDGTGYPQKLAGTDIALSGRIVAIADAYDVMTSARSYKKPLSPELARQELTSCAGSQFDPHLVRAFLQIGLGRLQATAGPFAWLANLTGAAQLPVPATSALTTTAWTAGVATIGVVTGAAGGILNPPPPETLAYIAPVVVEDIQVEALSGGPLVIALRAESGDPLQFSVGGAAHGDVGEPEAASSDSDGDGETWSANVTYTSEDGYAGGDGFGFTACTDDGVCDGGHVTIRVILPEPTPAPTTPTTTSRPTTTTEPSTSTSLAASTTAPAPTTAAPTTTASTTTTVPANGRPVAAADAVALDEDSTMLVPVLANDVDPEGDPLTIDGVGLPLHGTATIANGQIRYVPAADYHGTDGFVYTITDGTNLPVAAAVSITVRSINDAPSATAPAAALSEMTPPGAVVLTIAANDVDGDPLTYTITAGNVANRFTVEPSGVVRLIAPLDYETTASYSLWTSC